MSVQISYTNTSSPHNASIDPALVIATGQAEPTSRVLDGSEDSQYAQEWLEPAMLPDGRQCFRAYLFSAEDIDGVEAGDYPWDNNHVERIILAD